MYNTMKRIYKNTGKVYYLDTAVKKGWITEDEKNSIIEEVREEI